MRITSAASDFAVQDTPSAMLHYTTIDSVQNTMQYAM